MDVTQQKTTMMKQTVSLTQSFVLLAIVGLDLAILFHMIDSHLGLTYQQQDGTKMYFLWGFDYYIAMPSRKWTLAHATFGTIPLLGSLHQLSKVYRRENITTHRRVGFALIACGALQIPTTCYLGLYWAKQEIVSIMRVLFCIFAFLWGVWGLRVWYTVAVAKNIALHQAWGVRFAFICHYVPIFGRLLTVFVWTLVYRSSMAPEDRIFTLQTSIWSLLVLFFPLQEFFVWLETDSCWFYRREVPSGTMTSSLKDDSETLLDETESSEYSTYGAI